MSYVDDIESDFSVYHRVDDFWCRPADWILRMTGKLVAYGGALALAMSREDRPPAIAPSMPVPELSGTPAVNDEDTPPDVVAQMWQRAIAADFTDRGFQVEGFQEISSDEMRAMLDG